MMERNPNGSEDEEDDEEDVPVYVSANDMLPAGSRTSPQDAALGGAGLRRTRPWDIKISEDVFCWKRWRHTAE